MKHLFTLTFALGILFFCSASRAQVANELFNPNDSTAPKPLIGIKAGVNLQSITSSDWVQALNAGFSGGFYAGLHKDKIAFRAEFLVGTTSYKSKVAIDSEGNIGNFNVVYLNIPLLFEYCFIPHLAVQVGPQYSNMISATKKSSFDGDPKVLFKAGEFSGVLGLEAKITAHFNAGARYIMGFTNLNNQAFTSSQVWHTNTIQVYAGYTFK